MNRLKKLVGFIGVITDQNTSEIAESIGYTRTWLSNEMQKKEGNLRIEKLLTQKYQADIDAFFENDSLILRDDGQEEYNKDFKVIDAEELLVHDSLLIKGMLRVLLRNQAEIISYHSKAPLKKVLERVSQSVRDEISEEFDEL